MSDGRSEVVRGTYLQEHVSCRKGRDELNRGPDLSSGPA
jgi:hypothetical protein